MNKRVKQHDISKLLVANRGEIACRITRTARRMGLRSIAVYSDADAGAMHVRMADEAVNIGPAPAAQSYLDSAAIIAAARASGATTIHPGYGLLSENAAFAEAVEAAGLVFVGPPPSVIAAMADKAAARRLMLRSGVPCAPGHEGDDQSIETFTAQAQRLGYPVMVKAAAGGGGRGIRKVAAATELAAAIALARSEAQSAFCDDTLILEKAIEGARHVEIQIMADAYGGIIHLGERDCSVQRRNQKVIEEAPSPAVSPSLRAQMAEAAVKAAQTVGYVGAGTVEFLLDASGAFFFLEMNTRIQVEHPVTERVTGLDLVELQLCVARGDPLPLAQADVTSAGHAIEVRLYAEDPTAGFAPSPGALELFDVPSGADVRIDAGVETGDVVSPHYDPMLAKVIAHGSTREEARGRLRSALEQTAVFGPRTNRDFLLSILDQPDFVAGVATTTYVEDTWGGKGFETRRPSNAMLAAAAVLHYQAMFDASLGASLGIDPALRDWSSASPLESVFEYDVDGEPCVLRVGAQGSGVYRVAGREEIAVSLEACAGRRARLKVGGKPINAIFKADGRRIWIAFAEQTLGLVNRAGAASKLDAAAAGEVLAPMHGCLVALDVKEGARVKAGDRLGVLEAMKMQHELVAGIDGTISRISTIKGAQVAARDVILEIESLAGEPVA